MKSFGSSNAFAYACSVVIHGGCLIGLALIPLQIDSETPFSFGANAITITASQPARETSNPGAAIQIEVKPNAVRIDKSEFTVEQTTQPEASESNSRPTRHLAVRQQTANTITPTGISTDSPTDSPSLARSVIGRQPNTPVTVDMSFASTTLPHFVDNRPPTYPRPAIEQNLEGTVSLRVHIAASGDVEKVEILKSSGHEVLDGAARNAVKTWKAVPAKRLGRAVRTSVKLPVRFALP